MSLTRINDKLNKLDIEKYQSILNQKLNNKQRLRSKTERN